MPFMLAIQTPTRPVFEGEVESLLAPGGEGYLGVLAQHAPLISNLQPGYLELRRVDGETQTFFVSGGFLEVSRNQAIVLADSLEPVSELDADAAQTELEAARRRLAETADVPAAEQQLALARARMRAVRRRRGGAS